MMRTNLLSIFWTFLVAVCPVHLCGLDDGRRHSALELNLLILPHGESGLPGSTPDCASVGGTSYNEEESRDPNPDSTTLDSVVSDRGTRDGRRLANPLLGNTLRLLTPRLHRRC